MESYLKMTLFGFVAGVLSLLTLVCVVYLSLAVFSLAYTTVEQVARAQASSSHMGEISLPSLLGKSLAGSAQNALQGIWDLRVGFVASGVVGIFGAWSHRAGLLLYRRRAWWISFASVAALFMISSITWLFAQRGQIALWMAQAPETYRWRDLLLNSHVAEITVGPIFALTIASPMWAVWRWWYTKWTSHKLAAEWNASSPPGETHNGSDSFRSYTTRLHELKRRAPGSASMAVESTTIGGESQMTPSLAHLLHDNRPFIALAVAAAICFVIYFLANRYHEQTSLRLQHGATFVDAATQPSAEFPLQIDPDARRLRIVNINGLGVVELTLNPAENGQPIASVPDWKFEWRSDEYLYQDIPVQALPPGTYVLSFVQESGWGYFEYLLSQGGGPYSHISALAAGFFLACGLLLLAGFVVLAAARVRYTVSPVLIL